MTGTEYRGPKNGRTGGKTQLTEANNTKGGCSRLLNSSFEWSYCQNVIDIWYS